METSPATRLCVAPATSVCNVFAALLSVQILYTVAAENKMLTRQSKFSSRSDHTYVRNDLALLWRLSSTLVEEKPLCFMAVLYYGCPVRSTGKPLCFTSVLYSSSSSFFKRYSPWSLNGFHSYFHTISGLGVI